MSVVYWQIFVTSTIALTYLFLSRKCSFYIAIGWTIWTLMFIKTSSLIFLQLGNAWGTYWLMGKWKARDQELRELRKILKDYSYRVQEKVDKAAKEGRIRILGDSEHYHYLISSLNQAQSSLLILSGWVHDNVVNKDFIETLARSLQEGVNVYIGFGYEDSKGIHVLSRGSKRALEALRKLQEKADKLRGNLYIGRFNNHQKILIVDRCKVVCGSHNWLSNKTFRNKEKSIIIEDPELANELFNEISHLIIANPA